MKFIGNHDINRDSQLFAFSTTDKPAFAELTQACLVKQNSGTQFPEFDRLWGSQREVSPRYLRLLVRAPLITVANCDSLERGLS